MNTNLSSRPGRNALEQELVELCESWATEADSYLTGEPPHATVRALAYGRALATVWLWLSARSVLARPDRLDPWPVLATLRGRLADRVAMLQKGATDSPFAAGEVQALSEAQVLLLRLADRHKDPESASWSPAAPTPPPAAPPPPAARVDALPTTTEAVAAAQEVANRTAAELEAGADELGRKSIAQEAILRSATKAPSQIVRR